MEQGLVADEKEALAFERALRLAYKKASANVRREIEAFYGRYAKQQSISLTEARKRLDAEEFAVFDDNVRLYLEEINTLDSDNINLEYKSFLKRQARRARISREDALLVNVRHHIEVLTTTYENQFSDHLSKLYGGGINRVVGEVERLFKVDLKIVVPTSKQLAVAIKEKWQEGNYSSRIWQDKQKLLREMGTIIPRGFATGANVSTIATELTNKMNISYNNAKRLIRTETNYISNKGNLEAFKRLGVKRYVYTAILDSRTSEICRDMDGTEFPISEARHGINVPPLHPNCRSSILPVIEDSFFIGNNI